MASWSQAARRRSQPCPRPPAQGQSGQTLALTGTNFAAGAHVTFSGTGITVGTTIVTSSTHIDVTISIDPAAPIGSRDVTVTNTDGGTATDAGAFSVTIPPPTTVTSVTPSTRPRGSSTDVVVAGTNFETTPTVDFGSGITVTSVHRDSAVQLTVSITIDLTTSNLFRAITVTNPDGGVGTLASAFRAGASPIIVRNGQWFVRTSLTSGVAEASFGYGDASDVPVVGDWNGDGVKTPGVFRYGTWFLSNSFGGPADIVVSYGSPSDIPIVGHWGGPGADAIGVYRPSTGQFLLRNSSTSGVADVVITFGDPGEVPIVGDWDGNGTTTVGLFRNGQWLLRNTNTSGVAEIVAGYGQPGDRPVVGDWNGDGTDTFGIVRNGSWFVSNSVTSGVADIVFAYGAPTDTPLSWH